MPFECLDSLSLPGDPEKPNDDAFAHANRAAVVLDGATSLGEPLMPGKSDAAWVAHVGAERLLARLNGSNDARHALAAALGDMQGEFETHRSRAPRENYEIPCASMMLVVEARGQLDALWFGDCAALVHAPDGAFRIVGDGPEKRARESEHARRLAEALNANAAGTGVREIFLPALKHARNRINGREGSWLFSPDMRAAEHVAHAGIAAVDGTIVLLASDGFLALAGDYQRYGFEALLDAAAADGLAPLGEELRAIEAADPAGVRFPRFKKSDDATAVLLRWRACAPL